MDKKSPAAILFGVNYPRLQKIKAQYDPDMMFSRWFPVIPES